jgi:hypothetical protein
MTERRRRRRRQSNKSEAFWITACVALAVAGVFIWLVVSAAYTGGGRKPTDSNLTGPIITVPNTAVPRTDAGAAVPIIVTEDSRTTGAKNQKAATEPARPQEQPVETNWIESFGAAVIALFAVVLAFSVIGLWAQTRRLAQTAERHYREVERAFVHIDVGEAEETTGRDGGPLFRIEIRCTNNGTTPTRHGLSHVSWHHFSEGGPDAISFNDLWITKATKPLGIAVGPKGSINLSVLEIPKADIFKNPGSVFVWGWVDYNDIFEDSLRHRTEFCFELERIDRGVKVEIRYRNYRLHNGYDDECYRLPALYARSSV